MNLEFEGFSETMRAARTKKLELYHTVIASLRSYVKRNIIPHHTSSVGLTGGLHVDSMARSQPVDHNVSQFQQHTQLEI